MITSISFRNNWSIYRTKIGRLMNGVTSNKSVEINLIWLARNQLDILPLCI